MRGILILALMLSIELAKAQTYHEFPSDSTTWSFCTYSRISTTLGRCSGVFHYGIFGDTLINNLNYLKLFSYEQNGEYLNDHNPGFLMENATYQGALRADSSRKVYYLKSGELTESVFIDFGVQINDTFCFDLRGYGCQVVTAIDSQLINNNQYRRSISFGYIGLKWVEGIGNWVGGFFGDYTDNYWGLNCHSNKGQQLIGVPNDCSCVENEHVNDNQWQIVSIESIANLNCELNVFPNPTSGKVTIHLGKEYKKCTVSISQLNGKIVLSNQYNNLDIITLDLESLEFGSYIINLDTGKEKIGKIVIKK